MNTSGLLPKIGSGNAVAAKKAVGKPAIPDNLPPIALPTSRVASKNPYHLNGSDQKALLQSQLGENERQRAALERQLLLAEKKQDDELRVKQAAMIVVAKTIRIGTKDEGLWKRGQVSARQADLNSDGLYGQQALSMLAKRLHDGGDPFPANGRPSRVYGPGNQAMVDFVTADAVRREESGIAPRKVPMSQGNKGVIPGSQASRGAIPGTVSEYMMRIYNEFLVKHYPNGVPDDMRHPLSPYEIDCMSDLVFPECMKRPKGDRRPARRTQAYGDGYNFMSGCAGTLVIWGLKDTGLMTQLEIEKLAEELGLDPAMIGNIDESTSLFGSKEHITDELAVTQGGGSACAR